MRAIMMTVVGQQITLRVVRGDTTRRVVLTAAEWPNHEPTGGGVSASLAKLIMERPPDWGLKLEQTTDVNRQRFVSGSPAPREWRID
jgi:hypothetical protein